jgi:hypothetical protein
LRNRREFLLGGLAGGAAVAGASLAAARACVAQSAPPPERVAPTAPLYRLIVDERFAVTHGLLDAAHPMSLERDRRRRHRRLVQRPGLRWRRGGAVASLTTVGALFCLERLAWDAGMRLHFRVDHRCFTDGQIEHVLQAPPR